MECSIEGCASAHYAKGYCSKHWKRYHKYGDPLFIKKRTINTCSVDECGLKVAGCGLCAKHYRRLRIYGDPLTTVKAMNGEGTVNKDGYKILSLNAGKRRIAEHRYIMEQRLGRPLETHENVHHINGNRTDNRPENLELWSSSQPAGQRVADKIAWAKELLRFYEPEALA